MTESLVPPPAEAGDSDAPGEEGLPAGSLLGAGPQNAVAPGSDPDEPAPDSDAAKAAPESARSRSGSR